VEVTQLSPGLWRWSGFHPEWKEEVGCVYYEAPDAVVLVDPLVPPEEAERFWRALDSDVAAAGKPVHVLVTVYWHTRNAREVADRYDGHVWAPTRGRGAIERRAGRAPDLFRPGEPLTGGVEAFATARAAEVVFWIPEHRTLVPGDVILGAEGGGLRLCPASWLSGKTSLDQLRESLLPLLDLPAERVLVSHGDPVLANGREALAALLCGAAQGL
jgi:glyoxylase-like metal-dependent hydrolase (beta-lactamase superfamily II)